MQKKIINHWMNIIIKYNDYEQSKLNEIKYGLTGLYLTLSKMVVIVILALILKIFEKVMILLLFFNLIRLTSFGIHAKKSWQCLLFSVLTFILIPVLLTKFNLSLNIKIIIGIANVIFIYNFSPADTKKRPIINKKRRFIYKMISTFTALIFTILSFIINDNYIVNSLIFSLVIENIMISPITYKLLNEPYNNYKSFNKAII